MRSTSPLASTSTPRSSHTTMPSGAASISARNGTFHSDSIGDPDAERGTGAAVFAHAPPAVRLHGHLAERQAEPAVGASRLGPRAHEALEHLVAQRFGDAAAGVGDPQLGAAG